MKVRKPKRFLAYTCLLSVFDSLMTARVRLLSSFFNNTILDHKISFNEYNQEKSRQIVEDAIAHCSSVATPNIWNCYHCIAPRIRPYPLICSISN